MPDRAFPLLEKYLFSQAPWRIITTAVELDLFTPLAERPLTADELARARGTHPRPTRMICDALTGLQLLDKDAKGNGAYGLTAEARQLLVRGSPRFIGDLVKHVLSLSISWNKLTDVVRTGEPVRRVDQDGSTAVFDPLVRGLYVVNRPAADRLADCLGPARRILDVAAGSGVWGLAFAARHPQARLTAADFPPILEITREFASACGVRDRLDVLPGDIRQVDFGRDRFDLALLGHICHSEGAEASQALIRKVHRALAPGGRIAIIDMLPNADRTGPAFELIFAINMLLHTERGDTFTFEEYRAWLKEAGFHDILPVDIGESSPVVVGTR